MSEGNKSFFPKARAMGQGIILFPWVHSGNYKELFQKRLETRNLQNKREGEYGSRGLKRPDQARGHSRQILDMGKSQERLKGCATD